MPSDDVDRNGVSPSKRSFSGINAPQEGVLAIYVAVSKVVIDYTDEKNEETGVESCVFLWSYN